MPEIPTCEQIASRLWQLARDLATAGPSGTSLNSERQLRILTDLVSALVDQQVQRVVARTVQDEDTRRNVATTALRSEFRKLSERIFRELAPPTKKATREKQREDKKRTRAQAALAATAEAS